MLSGFRLGTGPLVALMLTMMASNSTTPLEADLEADSWFTLSPDSTPQDSGDSTLQDWLPAMNLSELSAATSVAWQEMACPAPVKQPDCSGVTLDLESCQRMRWLDALLCLLSFAATAGAAMVKRIRAVPNVPVPLGATLADQALSERDEALAARDAAVAELSACRAAVEALEAEREAAAGTRRAEWTMAHSEKAAAAERAAAVEATVGQALTKAERDQGEALAAAKKAADEELARVRLAAAAAKESATAACSEAVAEAEAWRRTAEEAHARRQAQKRELMAVIDDALARLETWKAAARETEATLRSERDEACAARDAARAEAAARNAAAAEAEVMHAAHRAAAVEARDAAVAEAEALSVAVGQARVAAMEMIETAQEQTEVVTSVLRAEVSEGESWRSEAAHLARELEATQATLEATLEEEGARARLARLRAEEPPATPSWMRAQLREAQRAAAAEAAAAVEAARSDARRLVDTERAAARQHAMQGEVYAATLSATLREAEAASAGGGEAVISTGEIRRERGAAARERASLARKAAGRSSPDPSTAAIAAAAALAKCRLELPNAAHAEASAAPTREGAAALESAEGGGVGACEPAREAGDRGYETPPPSPSKLTASRAGRKVRSGRERSGSVPPHAADSMTPGSPGGWGDKLARRVSSFKPVRFRRTSGGGGSGGSASGHLAV